MADIDIPEWAVDRALERFPRPTYYDGTSWKPAVLEGRDMPYANAVRFLAEQIARHEEPPVDPLLIEARKLLAEDHRNGLITLAHPWGSCILKSGAGEDLILEGKYDHRREVSQYLAALKRGMELAQTEK